MKYKPDIQFARDLDKDNEMLAYKEEFYQDDDRVYLVGNSLGLLSKSAEKEIMRALDEWREYGVEAGLKVSRPGSGMARS